MMGTPSLIFRPSVMVAPPFVLAHGNEGEATTTTTVGILLSHISTVGDGRFPPFSRVSTSYMTRRRRGKRPPRQQSGFYLSESDMVDTPSLKVTQGGAATD
jgi:hypothetical protein